MKTKFAFRLNHKTEQNVVYTLDILTALDKYISDSGLVLMYNGGSSITDYSSTDFVGVISNYNIVNDYIICYFDITNTKYNALQNLDTYPTSVPLIDGSIVEGEVKVNSISAVVLML